MIRIDNKNECCGCTACEGVCAHDAITMRPDALGFLYPVVDADRCVGCGLCEKVCQFHGNYKRYDNYEEPKVFGLRLKDDSQLKRSQSGGAFWGIAKHIVGSGGVVYGAAFDGCWRVKHQRCTGSDELEKLRMSKYVQSDMRGVFKLVKEDLRNGNMVLFSGTACQVAGLKAYVPQRLHDRLFCVDIICHGVPSPKVWDDYIAYLEEHYGSRIVKACFRDKRFGWHETKESFVFENGKEVVRQTSNRLYFSGISVRESCANCRFTNLKRVGDVTVGDFWGLPKDSPYEKDKKGLSLALVNSDKGAGLLNSIIEEYIVEQSNTTDCLQPQLQYPSELSPLHESFVQDYKNHGFLFAAKKYGDLGLKFKIMNAYRMFRTMCGDVLRAVGLK